MDDLLADVLNGRFLASTSVSNEVQDIFPEVETNLQGPEFEVSANPQSPEVSNSVLYQTEVIAEPEIQVKRGRGRPKKVIIEQEHPRYFHLPIDKTDCN